MSIVIPTSAPFPRCAHSAEVSTSMFPREPSTCTPRWSLPASAALAAVLLGWLCTSASAAVHLVPEEYPTIQAAVDASAGTDTISVASGVYQGEGNRDIHFSGKDLLLRSREGPEQTVIDCEEMGRAFYIENEDYEPVIEGFSVIHGRDDYGGGAVYDAGIAEPTFRRCVFASNEAPGGGAVAMMSGIFEDCTFVGNRATTSAGGGAVWGGWGSAVFDRCVFTGNTTGPGRGGALVIHAMATTFRECTITRNRGSSLGGGIYSFDGALTLERTICRGNCSYEAADIYAGTTGFIECSDIEYAEVWGDELVFGEGVIDADPLFCDPIACGYNTTEGDYRLRSDSPCLPEGNPCGVQIGALGVGCQGPGGIGACCLPEGVCIVLREDICEEVGGTYQGDDIPCEPDPCTPTSIERRTWGEIKASFR